MKNSVVVSPQKFYKIEKLNNYLKKKSVNKNYVNSKNKSEL